MLEPGRVADDVGLVEHTVDGADPVRFDAFDAGAVELDVVAGEATQPRPVVLQGALAGGRVVGDDLGEQFLVVDVFTDPPLEEPAGGEVAFTDRQSVGVVPVGVDPAAPQVAPGSRPELEEPEPAPEEGQVADGPLLPVGHRLVVVGVGEHPLGGALEDVEVRHLVRDGRADLEATGPGPDQGDAPAREVDRVVPADRVERRALEVVDALDVGHLRTVQRPDRADDRPGGVRLDVAAGRRRIRGVRVVHGAHPHLPRAGALVVGGADHLGPEPAVLVDPVPVHDVDEVLLELRLPGEVLAPVVGGLEGVAVEVAAHVDPRARVAVLPPRATRPGVGLEDGERQARLLEPDPGEQAGLAAADHDHGEIGPDGGVDLVAPGDAIHVGVAERHLVEHHRDDVVGDLGAAREVHHLVEQRGVGLGLRKHAAVVAIFDDGGQGEPPDLGLRLLVHEPLVLVEEQSGGPDLAPDPRRVAGEVHHRAHEGGDAHVLEGGGDRLVAVGERLPRVGMTVRARLTHGVPACPGRGRAVRSVWIPSRP